MLIKDLLKDVKTKEALNDFISETDIIDVCANSNEVKPGFLFVCHVQNKIMLNEYAMGAKCRGAVAIVCAFEIEADIEQIIVEDIEKARFQIFSNLYGNPEKKLKFIGVTGTNGKTSTTWFIRDILDSMKVKSGLIGTVHSLAGDEPLENTLTTPDVPMLMKCLDRMKRIGATHVIMEVSSHALAQGRVCGIEFEVGAFTNLTEDHLDYHKSFEDYKNQKHKLLEKSKIKIINIDDEAGLEFALNKRPEEFMSVTVKTKSADFRAVNIAYKDDKTNFDINYNDISERISVPIPGEFTVYNVLTAVACVTALGFDFETVCENTKNIKPVPGRIQMLNLDADFKVCIDYAHTPDALENILDTINRFKKARVITVFGCGGDRDKNKRAPMGRIACERSDYVIITSDNPRTENAVKIINDIMEGVREYKTPYDVVILRRAAIDHALKIAKKDDIVLLLGKGHEKYQIINDRIIPFDEEKIVKKSIDFLQIK